QRIRTKISQIFEFTGLGTTETESATAGHIVGLAGFEDVDIGDTLAAQEDGPLVGREGKLVTSRQLRERLYREVKTNVSISVEDSDRAGVFTVKARGAMQVAVLVE